MAKSPERAQHRYTRDKSIIDQVARKVPQPKESVPALVARQHVADFRVGSLRKIVEGGAV